MPDKTSPQPSRGIRPLPMPLWLQGVIESCAAALMGIAGLAVLLIGMWLFGAWANMDLLAVGQLAGVLWLAGQGTPVALSVPQPGTEEIMSGTLWFLPLGLTAILLYLTTRVGHRLARASEARKLWQALIPAVLAYGLFAFGLSSLISVERIHVPPAGVLAPLGIFGLGIVLGVRRRYGSWRFLGTEAIGTWMSARSQQVRWMLSFLASMVKAATVGILAAVASAAVLTVVLIGVQWAPITEVYQRLGTGIWGGLALTLLQAALLPNLVLWVLSWMTGIGFSLGTGSLIAPAGTILGPQPAIPLLAAIPPESSLADTWWVLLIPVACGIVAGVWLFRDGENHVEDWITQRVGHPIVAPALATLTTGVILAAIVAVVMMLVWWLSSGSWGFGKFDEVGPTAWLSGLTLGGEVGVGAMLGYVLAPLVDAPLYSSTKDQTQPTVTSGSADPD
ncbi:DUF6350 family protein [Auritidibacter sp. NML100628]|uniref:cell division protein PerM n=1 Tax=Auritidibacter sp. NML100628 TaxID=2170742 RepID=UPI0011B25BAD|nr:DUF6350 family protein [Auritidibacter sp. NML100628]